MKPWGNAGRPRRGIRSHVAPAQGLPQRLLAVVDVQLAVNGPNVAVHRVAASRNHAIRCPATAAKSQRRVASISGSSSTITNRIMPFLAPPSGDGKIAKWVFWAMGWRLTGSGMMNRRVVPEFLRSNSGPLASKRSCLVNDGCGAFEKMNTFSLHL